MPLRDQGTVVQCDFDDTVTEGDVSYLLLDAFAERDWRPVLEEYRERRISVAQFNSQVFAMVRADERTMLEYLVGRITIRGGFKDLVATCERRDFKLVIVSNGLKFYIERILADIGVDGIEVHAAETAFGSDGLQVEYVTPDGTRLDDGLKDYHIRVALDAGYRLIYIGDGRSDFIPARRCHHVFATANLLALCRREKVDCAPFSDFHDVIRGMESL